MQKLRKDNKHFFFKNMEYKYEKSNKLALDRSEDSSLRQNIPNVPSSSVNKVLFVFILCFNEYY
jgi:hypothetical protein